MMKNDFNVETDDTIIHRWPGIEVLEKNEKNALIIDMAVPGDEV